MYKPTTNIFPSLSRLYRGFSTVPTDLKEVLREKVPEERKRVQELRRYYGKRKIGETTVDMMYAGMREITGLICETSMLDPSKGIKFRDHSISECQEILPKGSTGNQPLPEGLFWLLITGDVPTDAQAKAVSTEWTKRSELPSHVVQLLKNMPRSVHPMSQLSSAVTALNCESKFAEAYKNDVPKEEYWEYVYEDAMDLIGKLPVMAATIYCHNFRNGGDIHKVKGDGDWTENFMKMMGYDDPTFTDLMRLYLTIHSDHEGGNVSAHTVHLVGSALSDPYLAFSAGLNGLAGPLHGMANQDVIVWLQKVINKIGETPTSDQLEYYVKDYLKTGLLIPGYGHAVLRNPDSRFHALLKFAKEHLPDNNMVKLVRNCFDVVPRCLMRQGKVNNPWPNVDANSGVLLQQFGMTEMQFYTVLFGVSRALGVMSQLVWSRAHCFPIERPRSFSTNSLEKFVLDEIDIFKGINHGQGLREYLKNRRH